MSNKRHKPSLPSYQVVIPYGEFTLESVMAVALIKFIYKDRYSLIQLDQFNENFSESYRSYRNDPSTVIIGIGDEYNPQLGIFHWFSDLAMKGKMHEKGKGKGKGKGKRKNKVNPTVITPHHYFNESKRCKLVPLATVGLVYKFFGNQIIKEITSGKIEDASQIKWLYERAYFDFIEIIDAKTRNIRLYNKKIWDNDKTPTPAPTPKFDIDQQLLPNFVKFYNPQLHEMESLGFDQVKINNLRLERFSALVDILHGSFSNFVKYFAFSFIHAKTTIEKAHQDTLNDNAFNLHKHLLPSVDATLLKNAFKKIIILDEFIPWKEHLTNIERETNTGGNSLYLVFPDSSRLWKLAAVPVTPASFQSRKQLPKEWCGLSELELQRACDVDDAKFVHSQGFIAGADSMNGCIQMALKAVLKESN